LEKLPKEIVKQYSKVKNRKCCFVRIPIMGAGPKKSLPKNLKTQIPQTSSIKIPIYGFSACNDGWEFDGIKAGGL